MSKWNYMILALALTEVVQGFSELRSTTWENVGWPVGVILLGLFLAVQLLERDSASLVRSRAAALTRNEPIRTPLSSRYSRNEVATHPVPTTAHTH